MRRNNKKERISIRYIYSFRGLHNVRPHPDWSLLGVKFKISDEHPRPFHMGVPPTPGAGAASSWGALGKTTKLATGGVRGGGGGGVRGVQW